MPAPELLPQEAARTGRARRAAAALRNRVEVFISKIFRRKTSVVNGLRGGFLWVLGAKISTLTVPAILDGYGSGDNENREKTFRQDQYRDLQHLQSSM